jgi:hypothetical protein
VIDDQESGVKTNVGF